MTMLDRALDLLESDPTKIRSLSELRLFAGIKLRSQWRLLNQLDGSRRVIRHPGNRFQARWASDEAAREYSRELATRIVEARLAAGYDVDGYDFD
jgi:hypothetical protein